MRKRAILIAYACSPYRGSEPGLGWHWSVEISKYVDTWVICEELEFKSDIINYIAANGQISGLNFIFIPKSRAEYFIQKIPGLFYVGYNLWHRRAYKIAKKFNKKLKFDLAHQVNLTGFREPGYLWKLNVPFVWGPVGGTQNYPWRFLAKAGIWGALIEGARNLANSIQIRFSPRVRTAAKHAFFLLTANSTGKSDLRNIYDIDAALILDVGISHVLDGNKRQFKEKDPLKILWSGVFIDRKALHLLIRALGGIPDYINYKLRILGKGPLEKKWRKLAKQKKVERNCEWMGWLPHKQAMEQFNWANIFVFSSLRDTCGTVVLEALSRGVPVICFDHQGAMDVVSDKSGIKIPVINPDLAITSLRNAIISIAQNDDLLKSLSEGALKQAKKYLWSEQGKRMGKIYANLI